MGKVAILKLGQGSFERGFPVTLQVTGDDGKLLEGITEERHLSAAPEVFKAYRKWQLVHWQRVGVRLQHKEGEQVTNVSLEDLEEELRESLNKWLNLNSSEFGPVRDALMSNLNLEDEVRVIFQTDDDQLRRIPWNLWEFFRRFHNAEGGVSPPNFQRIERTIPFRNKLRILAILGDSTGIDIEKDRQFLENLPNAETKFLVEPKRSEISDQLWEQSWDILFFAGHSRSEKGCQKGYIHLNPEESLSISQLKNSLRKAIASGLELAIFNSCDGLGIARELEELNIPVTIVMREPVPDLVAQEFLKYFLTEYYGGKSLYLAVRKARERLREGLEPPFAGADYLPVICQNPAIEPLSWQGLLQRLERRKGTRLSPDRVALVFTDLVNSTESKNRMQGSDIASRNRLYFDHILQPHRQRVKEVLRNYRGRIVETEGDGHFLIFADVVQAVRWAVKLQVSYQNEPISTPFGSLQVRIGIHAGSPLHNGEGFSGQEVDYAARVSALANGEQILLSKFVAELVRQAHLTGVSLHAHGDRPLKGIGTVPIFELLYGDKLPQPTRGENLSLLGKFLGSLSEQLFPADLEGQLCFELLCFQLRFNAQNLDDIKHSEIARMMDASERLRYPLPEAKIKRVMSKALKTLKHQYAAETQAGEMGKDSFWQAVSDWLWQKKFSAWLWEQLVAKASLAADKLVLEEVDEETGLLCKDRDFALPKLPAQEITVKQNIPYRLRVEPEQSGHLLLLNRGTTRTLYCVCPWLGYAPVDEVSAEQPMYIPQEGSAAKKQKMHLKYEEAGEEEMLALVTAQPLNLSWLSAIAQAEVPSLKADYLLELWEQLQGQANYQLFSRKIVVESL